MRQASLARPIFLLVIAAISAATIVTFAITFGGPPPRPAPLSVSEAARLIMGDGGRADARRTILTLETGAPRPGAAEVRAHRAEAELARLLQARPDDVRIHVRDLPERADALFGSFTLARRTAAGWHVLRSAPQPWITRWLVVTLGSMAAALLVLGGLAWWVARAINRPLRRLSDAAAHSRLGKPVAIPRGGPREVDELAESLATMQQRLADAAIGRTTMLAAIAHDLGTPLSRIAFWIEQLPDTARDRAAADIEEMRAMLQAVLRFARDERAAEAWSKVEIGSLIEALAEDMAVAGTPVRARGSQRAVVRGDPAALRRLLANLAENAVRYGTRADITWAAQTDIVEIRVDDAGPGFDPATSASLFIPFVRGDPSRNRATGGAGLGLAIVRSIAEAHGGEVVLGNHAGGGRVTLRLPLAEIC